jgi:PP-loop superfamily ATP-utilizing enzyme
MRFMNPLYNIMDQKERQLFAALERLGSVIVAYSGGADSAYLAWAATAS